MLSICPSLIKVVPSSISARRTLASFVKPPRVLAVEGHQALLNPVVGQVAEPVRQSVPAEDGQDLVQSVRILLEACD